MYNVRKIEENINICGHFRGEILYGEPLAPRTTFKVGGSAAVLIEPYDIQSLQTVLCAAYNACVPYILLGGGSNVVVPDQGIRHAVISLLKINSIELISQNNISENGNEGGDRHKEGGGSAVLLRCGSGCLMDSVREFCEAHMIGGMENFAGLPGTAGGAVFMNARCYDRSISDVLASVTYLDCSVSVKPAIKQYDMQPADWDYKKSPFQKQFINSVIISADFCANQLSEDGALFSAEKAASYVDNRREKGHFTFPSAGSVFKNNRLFGKPSGIIIDECGLRGFCIGGAQVAPWHGNFIINKGNATAHDILELVQYVKCEVQSKTGFSLEPEIIFLPEDVSELPMCETGAV